MQKSLKVNLASVFVMLLISNTIQAVDATSFGNNWNGMSQSERNLYVTGVIDGSNQSLAMVTNLIKRDTSINDPAKVKIMQLIEESYVIRIDNKSLISVVNDIYKDPANTFIDETTIIYLAQDKLRGKDIEPDLKFYRGAILKLQKK
jgi:hypothetical protein